MPSISPPTVFKGSSHHRHHHHHHRHHRGLETTPRLPDLGLCFSRNLNLCSGKFQTVCFIQEGSHACGYCLAECKQQMGDGLNNSKGAQSPNLLSRRQSDFAAKKNQTRQPVQYPQPSVALIVSRLKLKGLRAAFIGPPLGADPQRPAGFTTGLQVLRPPNSQRAKA